MERILITGASGFAAGHLIECALKQGVRILGTDRVVSWTRNSPAEEARREVPLIAWNIADPDGPSAETFEQIGDFNPDVVFHLAALSVPRLCGAERMTDEAYRVNVVGTQRVIELCQRLSGKRLGRQSDKPVRLVFISSSHVYGNSLPPEAHRCTESAPIQCRNGYAQSKFQAEGKILTAVRAGRLDGVIIRAFQHTGPRQSGTLMLPQWLDQIVEGRSEIEVYSTQTRIDLTDVRDMVRGYLQIARQGKPGRIYNLGGGNQTTCGVVLERLLAISGQRPIVRELKPELRYSPWAVCEQLRKDAIDWQPFFALDATLQDALSWRQTQNLVNESSR